MSDLAKRLLTPEDAAAMEAHGRTDAAVLLALYGWPEEPGLIFTERRADLRRHAGEISFPGGRQDEIDADLMTTALREAQEEIAGAIVFLCSQRASYVAGAAWSVDGGTVQVII